MKILMENSFLQQVSLSNIELYFSQNISDEKIIILRGEDFKHAAIVMRHKPGDIIYVTNGCGKIFKTKITELIKNELKTSIIESYYYKNNFKNIFFCFPRLKDSQRFEFALEKLVELGITNFVIFEAERGVAKGEKLERWNKIALAAMKQSLRSFLPEIKYVKSLKEISEAKGTKILFEQNFTKTFNDYLSENEAGIRKTDEHHYLIFGPEGGLTENEAAFFNDAVKLNLGSNRLRSETAIVTTAAILNTMFND